MKTLIKVISLKSDLARREAFEARAVGAKVPWSFYDAKTSICHPLKYEEHLAVIKRGRPLSRTEIACYTSHFSLWLEFLSSEADQLIVLEDDTLVDWGFIEKLVEHDFAANGIEYIRLAAMAAPPSIYKGAILGRYIIQYLGYALGTQAYLVTRRGAQFLNSKFSRIDCPIDDTLDATWRGMLPNFAICHPPVIEIAGPSRIGGDRNAAYCPQFSEKIRRLAFRVFDRLKAEIFRAKSRIGWGALIKGADAPWL